MKKLLITIFLLNLVYANDKQNDNGRYQLKNVTTYGYDPKVGKKFQTKELFLLDTATGAVKRLVIHFPKNNNEKVREWWMNVGDFRK